MAVQEVVKNIFAVGSKDRHRPFFDKLMPLSEGTSYNAFLIKGSQKTALIDTVYPPCHQELVDKLKEMGVKRLDYIVADHAEQDHTGTLFELLVLFPEAQVVCNQKCMDITADLYCIPKERYHVVAEGSEISLGDRTLSFMMMPWVHWPETMFTFLKEDNILFTTDFFGAHMTSHDLFWDGTDKVVPLAKAYYSEIMMPYAKVWEKYLDRIAEMAPAMVVPCHGPIYKDWKFPVGLYKKWVKEKENKVVMLSISMYGTSDKMADRLQKNLEEKGIAVKRHDAMEMNATEFAKDLVDCRGIIAASPTVLAGPHPAIVEPLFLINMLKPGIQYFGLIGSYSWGTQITAQVNNLISGMRGIQVLDPVLIKGCLKPDGEAALDKMAQQVAAFHK